MFTASTSPGALRQQSRDVNMSLVLISTVAMFLLCHTPRCIITIHHRFQFNPFHTVLLSFYTLLLNLHIIGQTVYGQAFKVSVSPLRHVIYFMLLYILLSIALLHGKNQNFKCVSLSRFIIFTRHMSLTGSVLIKNSKK